MSYWDETDRILARNGGRGPACSKCGKEMYPLDDHGRFGCGCSFFSSFRRPVIPQVPEGTELTDDEKRKIPAVNRLNLPPTKEEKKLLAEMLEELDGDREK